MRTEALLDTRHCRNCAFTNVAYIDPNMKSIFEFNDLRFSPGMYVLAHLCYKDDCCVVVYGYLFLPEPLQMGGGANQKSSTLFTADAATNLV